jgi:hypothetical protein
VKLLVWKDGDWPDKPSTPQQDRSIMSVMAEKSERRTAPMMRIYQRSVSRTDGQAPKTLFSSLVVRAVENACGVAMMKDDFSSPF